MQCNNLQSKKEGDKVKLVHVTSAAQDQTRTPGQDMKYSDFKEKPAGGKWGGILEVGSGCSEQVARSSQWIYEL